MYLIINVTFKNTNNESRMLIDGSVWINYNGKDYEFDKSETVMAEGYGILLDQSNTLISKTTNLVYKIPAEIKVTHIGNPDVLMIMKEFCWEHCKQKSALAY